MYRRAIKAQAEQEDKRNSTHQFLFTIQVLFLMPLHTPLPKEFPAMMPTVIYQGTTNLRKLFCSYLSRPYQFLNHLTSDIL